ncbi:MAG: ponA [Gammaproteobacteria bacterium]|jgi:penicillin-binding protein 1A|nr:ponA [Gammaproteobacteria bacterium]
MGFLRYSSKHFLMTVMSLLLSIIILIGSLYFYMMLQLPDVDMLKDTRLQVPLRIYSSDGKLMGEYGAMRRNPVELNAIPKQLVNAAIATEDQRFFEHSGVDMVGLLRAVRELAVTGRKTQGASTITMQIARNFFLSPEKTYTRKINEILLALKIDSALSKEKILELYLNKVFLGQRAYGVSAAASIYYGKTLDQLTLAEMATIAGLPRSPSRENPITNPAAAKARRNHVLQRMLQLHYINPKEYEEAIASPIETYYHGAKIEVSAPYVAEMVRNVIHRQFGEEGYTNGLRVYTTIDSNLQQEANTAIRDGLTAYERRKQSYRGPEKHLPGKDPEQWSIALADIPSENDLFPVVLTKIGKDAKAMFANGQVITIPESGLSWARRFKSGKSLKPGDVVRVFDANGEWQVSQIPQVEGALVSLDPNNGAILALVGGFKTSESAGFNRVVQAKRQPGSNFKPFIYAAALAKGFTLATIVDDAPLAINDTGDPNKLWRPQNSTKVFYGPTRLRIGLVQSINVMTVRVLQQIGIPFALDYVTQFGFDRGSLPPSLSLALGTADVTPLQVVGGYAVFANGGYRVPPYFIQSIENEDGRLIYEAHPPTVPTAITSTSGVTTMGIVKNPIPTRVISEEVAYMMTDALRTVIQFGSGKAASVLDRADLAGKTGTTQRQVDAWFSGFNRDIATTVWVGYDQPKSLREYGATAALPIWISYMGAALKGKPEDTLNPPNGIEVVRINRDSGLLASPEDPNSIFEVFVMGTAPIQEHEDQVSDEVDETINPDAVDGEQQPLD